VLFDPVTSESLEGGGIYNWGTLTVVDSTIEFNVSVRGTGIYNRGVLSVTNSSVSRNGVNAFWGVGGIYNRSGTVTVTNSTISRNWGGGLLNTFGAMRVRNSTISHNQDPFAGRGAGIHNTPSGTLYLQFSIVADNLWTSEDVYGTVSSTIFNPSVFNVIGKDLFGHMSGISDGVNGNIVGVDPLFDPDGLKDNGGPTWTVALQEQSPAVDHIPALFCFLDSDQRGVARPQGAGCDVGSYESKSDVPVDLPATLAITASSPSMVYGDDVPEITPSYQGFLDSDTEESLITPPICTTSATSESNVGVYQTSCSGAEIDGYDVIYFTGELTVLPRELTVTASSHTMIYGDAVPDIAPSYDGFINDDTPDSLITQPACSTTATSSSNVDTYETSCSGAESPDYEIHYVSGELVVAPRPITVTADSHFKLLGEDDPDLSYQVSNGGLVGEDEFTGELEREPGEEPGNYQIAQGSLAAGPNYDLTFVGGSLTIGYDMCLDFDNSKVKKAGSVLPIRLMLCDAGGNNVSSDSITLSATNLVRISSGTSGEMDPDSAGNANPDGNFRFADDRYIYNLSTKGMSQGTWQLSFTVNGSESPNYQVEFQLAR
jgi:hypothetical protein